MRSIRVPLKANSSLVDDSVIPAQAGIQRRKLDARLRGCDVNPKINLETAIKFRDVSW
jgi:hypothetical protein